MTREPGHYGAWLAWLLDEVAWLRASSSACPWSPDSRRDLLRARRMLVLARRHITPHAAALLPRDRPCR